ncbi:MAG: hypothetical protein Q9219_006586 [cf. Caloplaca sp. 3 TL-2023]
MYDGPVISCMEHAFGMETPTIPSPDHPSACEQAPVAVARTRTISTIDEPQVPTQQLYPRLPPISEERRLGSLHEESKDQIVDPQSVKESDQTYLYLAYGSNLAASTFRGARGIRPLAALNVVVPELVMTFDLAGFPYSEPCFANTAYHAASSSMPSSSPHDQGSTSEKTPLLPTYENAHWPKGLVGVVYEVTSSDFAHIIATEGGGAAYHDVLVACYPLPPSSSTVPSHPTGPSFKAHTLFAPLSPPGAKPPKGGSHLSRPDPNYAQPSERYLNLIRTGAAEHDIPREYRDYLQEVKPYIITTQGQRLGRFVFRMTWSPIISATFALNRLFSDKQGRNPPWLVNLLGSIFVGVWTSYDGWMKGVFGDGERTIEDGGVERRSRKLMKKNVGKEQLTSDV